MNTKKLAIIFLSYLIVSLICNNGIAGPIPSEIKSIVCFIFIEHKGKIIPNGTAFFVSVKDPLKPNAVAGYLITAKHVLYKPDTKEYLEKVYIRLNKKDGGSEAAIIPIKVRGSEKTVYFHSDTSVDLAAIPLFADQTRFDFKYLHEHFITTEEDYRKLKIREGSEVFFMGLFLPFPGAEKNYPVVRFGRIALVTDEKINWNGTKTTLYLIEAGSYGGNSGSPVFFYLGSDREPGSVIVGTPVLKLAGVMQGTFEEKLGLEVINTKSSPASRSNMGIAAIVPAYKLHELLFSEELKRQRGF